jgi:hypothetical protein
MLERLADDVLVRIATDPHPFFQMNKLVRASNAIRDKIQQTLTAKATLFAQASEGVPRHLAATLIREFTPYFPRHTLESEVFIGTLGESRSLSYPIKNWSGTRVGAQLILSVDNTGPRMQVRLMYSSAIWGNSAYEPTSPIPPWAFEIEEHPFAATLITESENTGTYILQNGTHAAYADGIVNALRRLGRLPPVD